VGYARKMGLRLTLQLLMAAALATVLMVPALTHEAPQGRWVGSAGQIAALPYQRPVTPVWDPVYVERFPGCSGRQLHGLGDLVIYTMRGDVRRMDFALAWDRNHNATSADDVWVVGWCR